MRNYICHIIAAAIATIGVAVPARGQVAGPVTPALTPEQIASSKATAKKHDEADAKEQRRLQTFKDRPLAAIIQRSFDVYTNYLALAAEMMPESGYGFHPTPELRSFGEQINHAASTHTHSVIRPACRRGRAPDLPQARANHQGGNHRGDEAVDGVLRSGAGRRA